MLGIWYTLVHAFAVPLLYILVKLNRQTLNATEVVFFYKFTLLVLILPWVFKSGITHLKTKKLPLHIARAIISTISSVCLMHALKEVDATDVTSLTYLENVIIAIIGIIIFKEPKTTAKLIASIMSCTGMLIVVNPDLLHVGIQPNSTFLNNIDQYRIALIVAVLLQSINWIIVKLLGYTESNKQQLFYMLLFSSFVAFISATTQWNYIDIGWIKWPMLYEFTSLNLTSISSYNLCLIIATSLCYLMHSVSIFKAFQHADISTIAPFDYTRLLFAGALGYLFFQQLPTIESMVGYVLIVSSGMILLRKEAKKIKKNN